MVGQFKVGDVVYYRSPESKYSVRRAKVCRVEKKQRKATPEIMEITKNLLKEKFNLFNEKYFENKICDCNSTVIEHILESFNYNTNTYGH